MNRTKNKYPVYIAKAKEKYDHVRVIQKAEYFQEDPRSFSLEGFQLDFFPS